VFGRVKKQHTLKIKEINFIIILNYILFHFYLKEILTSFDVLYLKVIVRFTAFQFPSIILV